MVEPFSPNDINDNVAHMNCAAILPKGALQWIGTALKETVSN